jgi:uncharacterized membrane protein
VTDKTGQVKAPPKGGGRVDAVDCARGIALIGMAAYHLSWDLADYRLVSPILPFSPPMRLLSHTVASAFLALVGVSLALAHRDRLNLPAFGKRFGVIAGAAALVTLGSSLFAPGAAIWFGILHCIAAASLLALPFVEAPAAVTLAAGTAAIALPFFVQSTLFDPPALLWLGLGVAVPNTLDWRPLLPWAGVVLIGLGVARVPGVLPWLASPRRWRAESAAARSIAFAGRHSLAVYLVHQPILIGLVATVAASGLVGFAPPPPPDFSAFLSACHRSCVARGRGDEDCGTSCRCVADAIRRSGQAQRLEEGRPKGELGVELQRMVDACMGR